MQRQPADVIHMGMGQQDRVDIVGFDPGRRKRHGKAPAPAREAARTGIDQHGAALPLDDVGRDGDMRFGRPVRGLQHGLGLGGRDALKVIEGSIEETVAEIGEDVISDAAAIEGGCLHVGLDGHEAVLLKSIVPENIARHHGAARGRRRHRSDPPGVEAIESLRLLYDAITS